MEIKNLKRAALRILRAIKGEEEIFLYGDADLDGVTSVIILKETIKNLTGKVSAIYFPDREKEGYGLTEKGLNYLRKLKNKEKSLLITLDLGISNFEEVKLAKKLGFEVVIIDHHQVLDRLPEAQIVVDPHQKGDKYPFKNLATVGIVFKLSEVLLKDKLRGSLRRNFLELVALATLADMMPQEGENKLFIEEGLSTLENSWRPGIQAFLKMEAFDHLSDLNQKVSKFISLLNVREIEAPNNLPASFRLLTSPSLEEAREIIERLLEKGKERKEKIEKMIEETERKVSLKEPIIFAGESHFEFTLISAVASRLCQKYQKPTFIFKKLEKESQGTVRTPKGIDGVALMKKCQRYLISFGGHPQASGFKIKNENLKKFKECLIKEYARVAQG